MAFLLNSKRGDERIATQGCLTKDAVAGILKKNLLNNCNTLNSLSLYEKKMTNFNFKLLNLL